MEPQEHAPSTSTINVNVVASERPAQRLRRVSARVLRRPTIVLSGIVLVVALLMAVWPSLFTWSDPFEADAASILLPPGTDGHLFGTDATGRDLYTRVVYGAGPSLSAAFIALVLSLAGGIVFGLLSGYFGGKTDALIMRAADVMISFPALLLAMAIVTVLGFGTINVAVAVGIVGIAQMSRVMRSEVMRVRSRAYVEAAGLSGARWWTVLLRHVLPNSLGPVVVLATLEFGLSILAIASLSFLGFGSPPPSPEWGSLVADGRSYIVGAPWLSAFPGLGIALVVLATNRISRSFDGELKG